MLCPIVITKGGKTNVDGSLLLCWIATYLKGGYEGNVHTLKMGEDIFGVVLKVYRKGKYRGSPFVYLASAIDCKNMEPNDYISMLREADDRLGIVNHIRVKLSWEYRNVFKELMQNTDNPIFYVMEPDKFAELMLRYESDGLNLSKLDKLRALKSIIKGLKTLSTRRYAHSDVKIDNILHNGDPSRAVLCDLNGVTRYGDRIRICTPEYGCMNGDMIANEFTDEVSVLANSLECSLPQEVLNNKSFFLPQGRGNLSKVQVVSAVATNQRLFVDNPKGYVARLGLKNVEKHAECLDTLAIVMKLNMGKMVSQEDRKKAEWENIERILTEYIGSGE